MSEDFPQEQKPPIDDLQMPTAGEYLAEQSTQIPEGQQPPRGEQTQTVNAATTTAADEFQPRSVEETSVASSSQDASDETRPDASKAWDMAHAGKRLHDQAVADGKIADEIHQDLEADHEVAYSDEYGEPYRHNDRYTSFDEEDYRSSAQGNEYQASAIEDWAGVLHDTPPSEAFKAKFELRGLNAESFHRLEASTRSSIKRAEYVTGRIQDIRDGVDDIKDAPKIFAKLKSIDEVGFFHHEIPEVRLHNQIFGVDKSADEQKQLMEDVSPARVIDFVHGEGTSAGILSNDEIANKDAVLDRRYWGALLDLPSKLVAKSKITQFVVEEVRSGRAARWE